MATNNSTNGPTGSNGVSVTGNTVNTVITTKGDTIVGSGTNTSVRLPALANNYVYTANPTKPNRVDWEPSGIGTWVSRDLGFGGSGNVIPPLTAWSAASAVALTADRLTCLPFYFDRAWTFTSIGMRCTTLAAASTVRLGIYASDGTAGYPGTLILDAGTIATTSTGAKTISINQTLFGKYWLVYISSQTPSMRAFTAPYGRPELNQAIGAPDSVTTTSTNLYGLIENSVGSYASALPGSLSGDTFTITDTSAPALIYLKV